MSDRRWLAALDGRVLRRGEPDMALCRKQFAARLPFVEPELLIRCATAADVARCIAELSHAGTAFALRSGGHCFADRSTAAAVVIDLGALTDIALNGTAATFEAGVLAADAVTALTAQGRTIPTGGCINVSVAGLALVGGFGFSGRNLGFLADRVRSFNAVLADGQLVPVDRDTRPDLFWGLRGGGGIGLAAVTAMTVETAPASAGVAWHGEWPLAHAAELIARWQRWAPHVDPAVNAELTLRTPGPPELPGTITLHGGATGTDVPDLRSALGAFADDVELTAHDAATLAGHFVGRLGHRGDPAWQPSQPYRDVGFQATRSHFLPKAASRVAIDALVACLAVDRSPTHLREIELAPWGGAYAISDDPACIAHRDATFLVRHTAMAGARSQPADRAAAAGWARRSHATLAAEANGAYPGYVERNHPAWREAAFGPLLPRLTAIKARYDPDRRFG